MAGRNPLVLSGIVLAGANLAREKDAWGIPRGDGGILTAEAIAALPLERLELAVLSACDTGLGDVAGGEGVFGLQRAFHLAGARNVVASLWKVSDRATAVLMAHFYRNLWVQHLSPLEVAAAGAARRLPPSGGDRRRTRAAKPGLRQSGPPARRRPPPPHAPADRSHEAMGRICRLRRGMIAGEAIVTRYVPLYPKFSAAAKSALALSVSPCFWQATARLWNATATPCTRSFSASPCAT